MNISKNKVWKILILALIVTTSACGQQRGGGQRGGQGGEQGGPPALPTAKEIKTMVSDLSGDLLLSDLQEEQVLELYTTHFEDVEDKTSSGRPDRDEMKALKTSLENGVKALLTNDQKKLYTTYLKKNNMRERPQRKN